MEITNAIFVGHLVSSMIGLLVSIQKPELLKMMEMNFVGWASMNAAMLVDNPHRPVLTENLKKIFFAEDPNAMSDFAQATFFQTIGGIWKKQSFHL